MSALSEPRMRNQTPCGSRSGPSPVEAVEPRGLDPHKEGSTMLKWLRKITSKPIEVDLGWGQEDLDSYLFDPTTRRPAPVVELLTTPALSEPSYYWRKDGS